MRSSLSSRPFLATVAILSVLTAYSFFLASQRPALHHGASFRRDDDVQCRHLDAVDDQCAFVKRHCADVDAGLVPYLELYYCTHKGARPFAFSLLVAWLALLFTTIGIAASDFFCVNLATISSVLGLSQSLAGVTFLALGNGSPDVFSTFAAMSSNSPAMAIGELIGAASFIAGVVAGSMALVREFRVDRESYARDICFFVVAVAFTMAFLADGRLHLWECCVMIGYYVVYVVTVVTCHWYGVRKKRRLRRDGEARSHVYAMPGHAGEELAGEPYRDDPEDNAMPRSIDTRVDDHHEMMLIAEVTSNMRVVRVGRRRPTCATPIRPSLVGALEFRSALSQLQRESNLQLSPLLIRGQFEDHIRGRARRGTTCNALYVRSDDGFNASPTPATTVPRRDRALSSGDIPTTSTAVSDFLAAPRAIPPTPQFLSPETERSSPLLSPTRYVTEAEPPEGPTREPMPKLRLQIPNEERNTSTASSPQSIFPRYADPLAALTPNALSERRDGLQQSPAAPVRWWPYWALPPPDVLLATLFPTLQDWREKSYWDRFLSAVSVPSIFLLVITLPVVDTEATEDTVFAQETEPSSPGGYGTVQASAPAISVIPADEQPGEGCNEEYAPPCLGAGPDADTSAGATHVAVSAKAPSEVRSASNVGNEPPLWNRWLVCLQLFSGPLFSTLVLWCNLREDMAQPIRELVRMIAFSLLLSVLLLSVVLLTTTKHRRPRLHYLLCFLGFVISVAWISTIASEVVGVLKAFGVILDISEALLGLTVFAAGNSIGDLVADITVARLGYPVMALSACFGGPMLNILLGIGIGGVMMMIKQANSEHAKHPERPMRYGPYRLQLGGTLLVSGVTLLLILVLLVVLVPMNRWVLSRKIGWLVMTLWIVSTVVSVVIELTGVWSEEKSPSPPPTATTMDDSIPPLSSRPLPDTICLFDVDGTLTPARLDASPEMLSLLRSLRQRCAIGFVGGSDLAKQEEQLGRPAGSSVTTLFDFCFSENGLTAFKMGEQLTSNSFIQWLGEEKYRKLVDFVLRYVADLDIPVKRGTFVEFRNGMVNISPVGRNASTQERLDFEAYDKVARVREKFVAALRERFADYGLIFAIGGQISFDVFPEGWDKTYCLRHLRDQAGKPGGVTYKKIHFFGDKTFQGGNDWEIYNHPDVTGHSVKGPEDTMRLLKELFDL
ncbi:hypothetical protein CP532_3697 [Ophiocordyceps camponoti-leonardi (nom. inval.)]|nr:hypothetical protein CP532_3697 [Ophiocordyceps camponoti-leonardi (nom. inval.)]